MTILVTGATGRVGSEVLKLLYEQGLPVRAAVTNIEKGRQKIGLDVDYVVLNVKQPETFAPALAEVTAMFLMLPPVGGTDGIHQLIQAAQQAGVQRVAYLSVLGAQKNRFIPHYTVEQYLMQSSLEWTLLRAGFFMQNLSSVHRDDIRTQHEIIVPAGKGDTSFIDVRDIAAVAVQALTEPGHARKAYDLTGSEALNYHQVASIFSAELSVPVVYREPSILEFVRHNRGQGVGWGFILIMTVLYSSTRFRKAGRISTDVARLLQRPPVTFRQFVADHKHEWV